MRIKTEFYTLDPGKNTLFIKAKLSWDERVVLRLFKEIEKIVSKLYAGSSWAVLTDASAWEFGTPEAAALFPAFAKSEPISGLACHAIVLGDSEIKRWILQTKMLAPDKPSETRAFSKIEDAVAWLESNGYSPEAVI